jgi:Fe-S-cluster containining protein
MAVRALRVLVERREAALAKVREAAREALARGDLAGAVSEAEAVGLAAAREAIAREGAPACAAGCAWCCHVHVEATRVEIEAIAAHLAKTRSEEDLAALREKLGERARAVEALDDQARWAARIPCALLDEGGSCSIHAVRPLRCRVFHSASAEPCRAAFAGAEDREAETIGALARAYETIEAGFDEALAGAGIEPAGERLEVGLYRALTGA